MAGRLQLSSYRGGTINDLHGYLEEIRREKGEVPSFSPYDGGTEAKCLFLLEAPGPQVRETGLVDRGNPDDSARNFTKANDQAGLDREDTISWNTVPWYVDGNPADDQIREGISWLPALLQLLPRLRVVVLLGKTAWWAEPLLKVLRPELHVILAPHPSSKSLNTSSERKQRFQEAIDEAAQIVNSEL